MPRCRSATRIPRTPGSTGHWRRTTALLAIYPTHLISLTPGYFWYLALSPRGVGQVHIVFGGGLAPEFIRDPRGQEYMATLKTLLDEVNAEDRRGVEACIAACCRRWHGRDI